MITLRKKVKRFLESESGPTAVEYAVMLALIIVTAIASIALFGTTVAGVWDGNSTSISNAFND